MVLKEQILALFVKCFIVPTPVRNLEAYPMNARNEGESAVVSVRWDQPRHYNGHLTGYSVEICAVSPDGTVEQRENCPIRLLLKFFAVSR